MLLARARGHLTLLFYDPVQFFQNDLAHWPGIDGLRRSSRMLPSVIGGPGGWRCFIIQRVSPVRSGNEPPGFLLAHMASIFKAANALDAASYCGAGLRSALDPGASRRG